MSGVLIKKGNLETEPHTQVLHHVKPRVMLSQAKGSLRSQERDWNRNFSREHGSADTSATDFQPLER